MIYLFNFNYVYSYAMLIQESKLIFVSLQELDKFVQASVNIHSTNVKTCWVCEHQTMSGNLDFRMVYFAERLNGGTAEWWNNYQGRSEGSTGGGRGGTAPPKFENWLCNIRKLRHSFGLRSQIRINLDRAYSEANWSHRRWRIWSTKMADNQHFQNINKLPYFKEIYGKSTL